MPLKGPVLTESIYGDLSLRSFGDLDILIYEHDALRAYNLLISQGYKPNTKLEDAQFRVYQKTQDQIAVVRDDIRLIVELHWKLVGKYSSFPFDLESLKDRLELVTFAGKKVFQLCHEELLVYLCIHGTHHCWEKLDLICCVAELIWTHPPVDWVRVLRVTKRMHCERMLLLGLSLTHDLLGMNIPVKVLERMERDRKINKLAKTVYDNLFKKNNVFYKSRIKSRFSFFHMEVRERIVDRIRYGLHLLIDPTKKDWKLLALPGDLAFIHYVFRPIRLGIRLIIILLSRRIKATKSLIGLR